MNATFNMNEKRNRFNARVNDMTQKQHVLNKDLMRSDTMDGTDIDQDDYDNLENVGEGPESESEGAVVGMDAQGKPIRVPKIKKMIV